jgi:hypothetical protein
MFWPIGCSGSVEIGRSGKTQGKHARCQFHRWGLVCAISVPTDLMFRFEALGFSRSPDSLWKYDSATSAQQNILWRSHFVTIFRMFTPVDNCLNLLFWILKCSGDEQEHWWTQSWLFLWLMSWFFSCPVMICAYSASLVCSQALSTSTSLCVAKLLKFLLFCAHPSCTPKSRYMYTLRRTTVSSFGVVVTCSSSSNSVPLTMSPSVSAHNGSLVLHLYSHGVNSCMHVRECIPSQIKSCRHATTRKVSTTFYNL